MHRTSLSAVLAAFGVSALCLLTPGCSGTSSGAGPGARPGAGGGSATGGSDGVSAGGPSDGTAGSSINVGTGDMTDAGIDDTSSCATGAAIASHLPVYLEFVLDGSKSMNGPGSWAAAVAALNAIFGAMKTTADMGVGAGLIVFSDERDPNLGAATDPAYPTSVDVPLDFVDDAQLTKLVARTANDKGSSNTPTGHALTGAYSTLAKFQPSSTLTSGGKKVVVLITDGAPTDQICSVKQMGPTVDYTQNGCVKMAATQLATVGPDGPIQTFVIGVGPLMLTATYDPFFLGALAQAGGSATPGCDPKSTTAASLCYFSVDPSATTDPAVRQEAFMTALDTIRGEVASCSLGLKATTGNIDPTKVRVTLNNMTIYKDPVDGWSYDDPSNPSKITLHGKSCEALKNNPSASIDVVLGCAVQPPR